MKVVKAGIVAVVALGAALIAVPAASAQPPNAVQAYVECDGYAGTWTWLPNFNAAFNQGATGITGIVIDPTDVRVGVTMAAQEGTLRGNKPVDERGMDTTLCDVQLGPVSFEDVVVHLAP